MIEKILNHKPYARRLHLSRREVLATVALTALAGSILFASQMGWNSGSGSKPLPTAQVPAGEQKTH